MTKPAQRPLMFDSIDEILPEVERLSAGEVTTTGQFTYAQILEHLARTLDIVCGDGKLVVSLPMRIFARAMRPVVLSRPIRPGFNLPSSAQWVMWPKDDVNPNEALRHFRSALARYQATEPLPAHPLFGSMTRPQHDKLHCGHCAMHLSLVHPVV